MGGDAGGRRAALFVTLGPRQRPVPGLGGSQGRAVQTGRGDSPGRGGGGGPDPGPPPPPPGTDSPLKPSRRPFPPILPSSSRLAVASPKVVLKTQRLGEKRETFNDPGAWGGAGGEG